MKTKIRIFLISMFLLMSVPGLQAKVYLVSVGIADYPGTQNDLRLPVKDAKTIAWLYSKNTSVDYVLLLDWKATLKNVLAAMDKVFAKAGTNDIVLFFFSGHGYPGGFVVYDGQLTYETVRNAMAKSSCRNKMIFADACFSGKMRTGRRASENSEAEARKANVMLFLSSRSNETSIERRDMSNGFFTTYLQKGLRGGADTNKDRMITARELFQYVHNGVVQLSNGKQHPVMWGRFPNNMPVMVW